MLTDQRKRGWRTNRADQGGLVLPMPAPQTLIQKRLIDTAGRLTDPADEITYQHSILCQTGLPYRNPGADVREWQREQGNASLMVEAGQAKDMETGQWVKLGLPWGPNCLLYTSPSPRD